MQAVTSSRLSLVLPSLPDDSSELLPHVQTCAEHVGEPLALLRKLLSRADKTLPLVTDRQALIFYLLSGDVQDSPPVAALRALADGLQVTNNDYWLCIDPVHLHPDLDHLLLFSGESFFPTPAQATKLVDELNQLFIEDTLEFVVGSYRHWYLRSENVPEVSFTALDKVQGKNVLPFMPAGSDEARWRRYLNEIQMQMTASEVNQQRMESSLPAVNSVWCWGGGKLPESRKSKFSRIYTQQAFSQGLARHMNIDVADVPNAANQRGVDAGESLVEFAEFEDRDDPNEIMQFLFRLERDYLQPLQEDIRRGRLNEVAIYFAGKRFLLNKKTLRRWWRRSHPLIDVVT